MKPAFLTIILCAFAPTVWTQGVGACSSKSIPQEFETYCQALKTNAYNSLAHYRIAEQLFLRNNWQSAANEFREALNGNLDPKWTEVWAEIGLGKIFEISGQRDRALNEYKQARRTGDNTFAAQDEVTRLVEAMGVRVQPSPRIVDPRDRTEPVEAKPAEYTEEARIAELEGTVLLQGVIGEDGRAHDLTVLRPLGLGLDESAIAAVRQWLFISGHTDGQAATMRSVIAVDFFLSSKPSRWHLIRADFNLPSGGVRPTFLRANYPPGAGVSGTATIDEGRLLGAIGRQATATISSILTSAEFR
jgi:TonB family protein